jgi:hypothetical protein
VTDKPPFNAMLGEGIVKGICVILSDNQIVYAGPIKGAPDVAGMDVVMNEEDLAKLRTHVERHRH